MDAPQVAKSCRFNQSSTRPAISSLLSSHINAWLLPLIPREGKSIHASPVSARQLGAIVDLITQGTISGKIAKDLFEIVWAEGGEPGAIVETRGMKQVTDTSAIEKLVDDIVARNPDKVEQARAKPAMLGWFVGQVMKASAGKANPQAVNDLLRKKLGI